MTITKNVHFMNNSFFEKIYEIKVEVNDTISNVTKKIFNFLHENRYTFSAIAWTSLFVQIGVSASSIILPEFLHNLENCTETFCFYFNKTDTNPYSFCFSPCCNRQPGMEVFSSLESCTNSLIALYSRYKQTYWNKICPSVDIEYLGNNLSEHMQQCFSELCLGDDFINLIDQNVFDWCPLKEIANSTKTLRSLIENVMPDENPEWTKEDLLSMIIVFLDNLNKDAQSLLSPIISNEKLLTPALSPSQDFDLIKKGIRNLLSASIKLIQEIANTELNANYLKIGEHLQSLLQNLEKAINFKN